ncbi:MAG: hypothetical protein VX589_13120 [Myxococcota bacterium]|nr:hypothetical protein [Myxococcota bacterium]
MMTRELEYAAHRVESEVRIADAVRAIRTMVGSSNFECRFDWDARWSTFAVPHGAIAAALDASVLPIHQVRRASKEVNVGCEQRKDMANVIDFDPRYANVQGRQRKMFGQCVSKQVDSKSVTLTGGQVLEFPTGRAYDSRKNHGVDTPPNGLTAHSPAAPNARIPSSQEPGDSRRLTMSAFLYRAQMRRTRDSSADALRARWGRPRWAGRVGDGRLTGGPSTGWMRWSFMPIGP